MLTIEEQTIVRMYRDMTPTRQAIIAALKKILPHFTEEESEMLAMTQSALRKLMAMNDQAFSGLDFSETLDLNDDVVSEA